MSNDLLFSVLPRQGKVAVVHDEQKVKKVEKEARLRKLNEEDDEHTVEEREAREKYLKKQHQHQEADADSESEHAKQAEPPVNDDKDDVVTEDKHGNKHLDVYI